jgi:futalosine hydrolase
MPVTDCFADAGIEDGNNFLTLSEAGLVNANEFPFTGGLINADQSVTGLLKGLVKPVKAITVNTSTGSDATRNKLVQKYNPDIESMEGATFFYICSREKIPFLALRSISNMVEIRNKANWNIKLAISNLTEKLNEVVLTLT